MPRRLIGKVIDGRYYNLEEQNLEAGPKALPKYGEGAEYFKGVKPSHLNQLDNRQLFMAHNRLAQTISEGRGTKEELANARDAAATIVREARARRATLHD